VATLIAVYGVGLVTPLGWMYAGIVWAYALTWFLITDPVKLLAYKALDTVKADSKSPAQAELKPAADVSAAADVKAAPKPGAKSDPEPKPAPTVKAAPSSGGGGDSGTQVKDAATPKPPPANPQMPAPQPTPQHDVGHASVKALLDTKLGDVLLAVVSKDPAEAGRLISQAITEAESPPAATPPPAAPPAKTDAPEPAAATPKAAE
jgi:hypothetical protein